jgi:nitrous oxidase accessory protein NosD
MFRISLRAALVAALAAGALVLTAPAFAGPPKTVCASGCQFTSINAAIAAASPGDTITIGKGKYYENVVVTKPVTLQGQGNGTVIYPAVSSPTCGFPSSLCGGTASNIVLVEADNVTITNLRLEGDNPNLTSGVARGGADLDARNGIITNHAAGTFNNLTVSDVKVADIYLRGIYASSGGTFAFGGNTVDNVQGDANSIGIFSYLGSGVVADNKVTNANDAISANHSQGIQFLDNEVSKSASGIHTDNAGDSGGTADLIQGNTVKDCKVDGYGIWVFVPYNTPTFDSNKVQGCYVGLAAFGGAGGSATFSDNDVKRAGAKTTDPAGTYGAYITTDQLGFATGNVNVTLLDNSLTQFTTGLFVTQAGGGLATVIAHNNTFKNNTVGANGDTGTSVNAENNWWGCKQGPNVGPACDTAIGTVDYTPWLTK